MKNLKVGDTGAAVTELQRRLKEAGFTPGVIDGDFGPKTDLALRDFQAAKSLKVDGIAGSNTMRVLNKPATETQVNDTDFKLNKRSLDNLAQCHDDLQKIGHELAKVMPIVVICGHRGKEAQEEAFRKGTSKLRWPNSKHNKTPAMAFDACPAPVDWDNTEAFHEMRRHATAIAERLGIMIRLISWDLPHIELA